ncbi:MAG: F0F1 ATP synthase subunit B [Cyanobacteria bacterium P01_A01_bin.123]
MEAMNILWLLAVEEAEVGLNFDVLETNIINLVIIIGVLVYFGSKFLGNTLSSRRSDIETAIRDAEQRKQVASSALAEEQQKLAQAQVNAEQIKADAQVSANKARETVLAQAEQDVERLRAAAAQDLSAQQERVIRELRQRIAALVITQVENELPSHLNGDVQKRLVDQSIALLGGR